MFLRADDCISGQEGTATASINGIVTELFYIKTFEATMEKKKTVVKTLGKRSEQHKAVGWSGKGSLNMFYVTTELRALALTYAKTGKDVYFNITVTNEDPTSSVGKQTLIFYNCNLDTAVLAKLDVGAEVLDEDADFTFDDFDILDSFGKPAAL